MKPKSTLILAGIACLIQPGIARSSEGHLHHHVPTANADRLSGKSLYNIDSKWRTPANKQVQISLLKGAPQLITMLYTSCPTACPMLVEKMKDVTKELPVDQKAKLKMTVFSFDPSRDTPEKLSEFAKKRSLDLSYWNLLSPKSEADSNELAGVLGIQFKKAKDDYIHSNMIFLLNEQGEIVASDEGLTKARPDFIAKVKALLQKK